MNVYIFIWLLGWIICCSYYYEVNKQFFIKYKEMQELNDLVLVFIMFVSLFVVWPIIAGKEIAEKLNR